jgi:hypothetical protein
MVASQHALVSRYAFQNDESQRQDVQSQEKDRSDHQGWIGNYAGSRGPYTLGLKPFQGQPDRVSAFPESLSRSI